MYKKRTSTRLCTPRVRLHLEGAVVSNFVYLLESSVVLAHVYVCRSRADT